jgi:hypothetical protein
VEPAANIRSTSRRGDLWLVGGATAKVCVRCETEKPASDFSKDRHHTTGLKSECKACCNARLRARRLLPEVGDRLRAYQRASSDRHPVQHMIKNARQRAQRLGLPFDLVLADVVIPDYCPVLGIRLNRNHGARPDSPSLDRIDPTLGYVRGNVAVISMRANRIKDNATVAEHERVLAWMRSVGAP